MKSSVVKSSLGYWLAGVLMAYAGLMVSTRMQQWAMATVIYSCDDGPGNECSMSGAASFEFFSGSLRLNGVDGGSRAFAPDEVKALIYGESPSGFQLRLILPAAFGFLGFLAIGIGGPILHRRLVRRGLNHLNS